MITNALDLTNPVAVRLEAERRQRLREQGASTFDAPAAVAIPDLDRKGLEKLVEQQSDVLMRELGFEVVKFSHPGKTKQTEGIADRLYVRRARVVERANGRHHQRGVMLWFECKSATGKQRPGQQLFGELITEADGNYVCGTHEALVAWLVAHELVVRVGNVLEPR